MATGRFDFTVDEQSYEKIIDVILAKMDNVLFRPIKKGNFAFLSRLGVDPDTLSARCVEECIDSYMTEDGVCYTANEEWIKYNGETKENKFLRFMNIVTKKMLNEIIETRMKNYFAIINKDGKLSPDEIFEEKKSIVYKFYSSLHKQFALRQAKTRANESANKTRHFDSARDYLKDCVNGSIFLAYFDMHKRFPEYFNTNDKPLGL